MTLKLYAIPLNPATQYIIIVHGVLLFHIIPGSSKGGTSLFHFYYHSDVCNVVSPKTYSMDSGTGCYFIYL